MHQFEACPVHVPVDENSETCIVKKFQSLEFGRIRALFRLYAFSVFYLRRNPMTRALATVARAPGPRKRDKRGSLLITRTECNREKLPGLTATRNSTGKEKKLTSPRTNTLTVAVVFFVERARFSSKRSETCNDRQENISRVALVILR